MPFGKKNRPYAFELRHKLRDHLDFHGTMES